MVNGLWFYFSSVGMVEWLLVKWSRVECLNGAIVADWFLCRAADGWNGFICLGVSLSVFLYFSGSSSVLSEGFAAAKVERVEVCARRLEGLVCGFAPVCPVATGRGIQ